MTKSIFLKLSFAACLFLPLISHAATIEIPTIELAKLSLSANGTIRKPADELQMKIGVVTIEETAEAALAENSQKMQAVTEALEAAGLDRKEYQTGHFSINPTYSPYPQNPPANWKPTINGYEVTNSINIQTGKIDLAGKWIDAANKAGANNINDIRFGLHDPRSYWKEALSTATTNAMDDARTIAATAEVQLERVLSISLNSTQVSAPYLNAKYVAQAMGGDTSPPLEAGEVTITANISIVYEIGN